MDTVDSDLEDFAVDGDEQHEAVIITIRERPQRKNKRKQKEVDPEPEAEAGGDREVDGGSAGQRNGATAVNGPVDVEEPEAVAPKRRRVVRKARLS